MTAGAAYASRNVPTPCTPQKHQTVVLMPFEDEDEEREWDRIVEERAARSGR